MRKGILLSLSDLQFELRRETLIWYPLCENTNGGTERERDRARERRKIEKEREIWRERGREKE
eukprot:778586-Amorphochlora_amoeboformis.AAC.1